MAGLMFVGVGIGVIIVAVAYFLLDDFAEEAWFVAGFIIGGILIGIGIIIMVFSALQEDSTQPLQTIEETNITANITNRTTIQPDITIVDIVDVLDTNLEDNYTLRGL